MASLSIIQFMTKYNKETKPIILSEEDIAGYLLSLPGWTYGNNKLSKEYTFKSFMDGIRFIYSLALFFERIDHHADMHIFYKKIIFDLQRFDVGGKVTDRDFVAAKEIESRYKNLRLRVKTFYLQRLIIKLSLLRLSI